MTLKDFFAAVKTFFLYFFAFLLVVVYLFLIGWTYCYSLYVCYLLLASFVSFIVLLAVNRQKRQAVNFLLFGLFLLVVSVPFNLKQYNRHGEDLQNRINHHIELTNKEKLGVYGCLIMITVFDAIPFPEVSKENFYLFFPPPQNNRRVFFNNSMFNSPSIMKAVKTKEQGLVGWNKWAYVFNSDFRYSLAFDPCTISTVEEGGLTKVTLTTHFSYRQNYPTVHASKFLWGLFAFRVDEGLFWYLQEKKWLHPYTAVWKAELKKI